MTPRSLVGMTMGARKRRWARDFDAIPQSERASKAVSMLAAYGVFPKQGNQLAQLLRPCKGCAQCLKCSCGNVAACIGLYEPWSKHQPAAPACDQCCGHGCEDGYCYKLENFFPCNGSGVLPAKKAKAAK